MFKQAIVDGRQVEEPDNWLAGRQPVGGRAAGDDATRCASAGSVDRDENDAVRTSSGDTEDVIADGVRHRRCPAIGNGSVNTLRLWTARPTQEFDLDALQPAAITWARCEASNRAENISRVLYPNDTSRARQGAAPAAGVLLRHRVAAGHRARATSARMATLDDLPEQGGHPAQRHAPGAGHPRADAHPDRRARLDVGARRGTSPRAPSPTPTTRCCPRRWRSGRWTCWSRLLPRHLRDHLPDQPPLPARRPAQRPATSSRCAACRSSPRTGRSACAWPTWRWSAATRSTACRELHTRAADADALPGLRRSFWPGEVHQQDQRHHPAPLAAPGQSAARRL